MAGFSAYLIILYVLVTPLAAWRWQRDLPTIWVWVVPAISIYPLFWFQPGPIAVLLGMATLLILLRALDARVSFPSANGGRYALYCHWLVAHHSEHRHPESRNGIMLRVIRGAVLCLATLALARIGRYVQLWQHHPYLDDLLMAAEAAMCFIGLSDLITAVCMKLRLQFFLVDAIAAGCALAPSLREFWNRYWNRPTAGVLRRGIFTPLGGRRRRISAMLAVFFACGLMHALPLTVAGENRATWLILALGTQAFFMLQALALILEHWLPKKFRRGWRARVYFYAVMAVSLPLYPAPILIALGVHQRPPEAASLVHLLTP